MHDRVLLGDCRSRADFIYDLSEKALVGSRAAAEGPESGTGSAHLARSLGENEAAAMEAALKGPQKILA